MLRCWFLSLCLDFPHQSFQAFPIILIISRPTNFSQSSVVKNLWKVSPKVSIAFWPKKLWDGVGLPLLSTLQPRLLTNTIHKAIHKNASVEEKDDYYRSLVMNQINIQKCHCGSLNGSWCRQLLRLVVNGTVPSSFQKVVNTSFQSSHHLMLWSILCLLQSYN